MTKISKSQVNTLDNSNYLSIPGFFIEQILLTTKKMSGMNCNKQTIYWMYISSSIQESISNPIIKKYLEHSWKKNFFTNALKKK